MKVLILSALDGCFMAIGMIIMLISFPLAAMFMALLDVGDWLIHLNLSGHDLLHQSSKRSCCCHEYDE